MLVSRWGILWRKYRFKYDDWANTMIVLMKLHNFIMDRGEIENPKSLFWEDTDDVSPPPLGSVADLLDDEQRPRSASTRRKTITENLEESGIGRPLHASCNSRSAL